MNNWQDIDAWAKLKLESSRNQNDGDLNEIETAKLRGRIALLKEIVALPQVRKAMEAQQKSVLPE